VTIALAIVDDELALAVRELRPLPEQERFSGRPAQTLPDATADPLREPVAVLEDGTPVGFLILDRDRRFALHTGGAPTLGVRAFFVAAEHQGRGVGTAALRALPAFVAARHPDVTHLALTVNVANPTAVRTYARAGWRDTGHLDHSGAYGPQHVLVLDL
jgi:RimJ/RimL family protein N-acetyltransferase